MSKIVRYILFIGLVVGAGTLSGLSSGPGTSNGPINWYLSLEKPFFNPPAWIFGPVWTVLYILIGIAGARIWERARKSAAMKLWFAQLVLNLLWSPAFFGLHNPELGLVVIAGMLVTIIGFMIKARPIDRVSMLLFIPYLAWVAFASLLNLSIALMN
ncbi:sensor histidine kinase [Rhizobium sp. Root274]|uniref:TspO/MBR family protein n=1 Tax=unclassified Rhizobium TaxID=2613769 RepID=UPI00071550AD|nr:MULTISPECIES: TspO/MBR family protein [unclassified Rhizobium]KQW32382.1 sensor histidine kinase [Rhizobium sp. Root1240]KRD33528.1 sensor histidine kinase [Rhizobium sp. Root274]